MANPNEACSSDMISMNRGTVSIRLIITEYVLIYCLISFNFKIYRFSKVKVVDHNLKNPV